MSTITQSKSLVLELNKLCEDLKLTDIKYMPSPKDGKSDISNRTKHAIHMLKVYKAHKEGNRSASIKDVKMFDI